MRPICQTCDDRLVAINKYVGSKIYYRKQCDNCLRKGKKVKPKPTAWARSGYTKKTVCEKCNFKSKLITQMFVFHVDGNLKNVDWINLKTVCANCKIELIQGKTTWRESPLVADY